MTLARSAFALGAIIATVAALTGCASATPAPAGTHHSKTVHASTPAEVANPAEENLKGIYFFTDASTAGSFQIGEMDPASGAVTVARTFAPVGGAIPTLDNFTSFFVRMSFDPQFHRVTAILSDPSDGSQDVGWITDTGRFVDVTKAVTASGSFSGETKDGGPAFGPDGAFYFDDINTGDVYKVASAHPTSPSDAVQVQTDGIEGSNPVTWVYPDNVVVSAYASDIPDAQNITPGLQGQGAVDDWLNATTMLTTDSDDSGIRTSTAVQGDPSEGGQCFGSGTCVNEKELLPTVTGRVDYNPISSPDGSQVAFLSALTDATKAPQLFIVPSEGGTPQLVSTSQSFETTSSNGFSTSAPVQLIGWR